MMLFFASLLKKYTPFNVVMINVGYLLFAITAALVFPVGLPFNLLRSITSFCVVLSSVFSLKSTLSSSFLYSEEINVDLFKSNIPIFLDVLVRLQPKFNDGIPPSVIKLMHKILLDSIVPLVIFQQASYFIDSTTKFTLDLESIFQRDEQGLIFNSYL